MKKGIRVYSLISIANKKRTILNLKWFFFLYQNKKILCITILFEKEKKV